MSEPGNDRPATRSDVITAVIVLILAMTLLSNLDSCSRRIQIDKLREDLEQRR